MNNVYIKTILSDKLSVNSLSFKNVHQLTESTGTYVGIILRNPEKYVKFCDTNIYSLKFHAPFSARLLLEFKMYYKLMVS